MFHKLNSVAPLENYVLLVHFSDGSAKQYDVKPLISKFEPFGQLETTAGLFQLVHADAGGYGVSWNDDIDISCDELWKNGTSVRTPFDQLISFSDATDMWSLNESTLRKAISYGKLKDGVDVKKYGKQWIVTKDAMLREYGEPKAGE